MSRLTKKENNIYTFTHTDEDRQFVVYDLCNKLGKLEDLEDELGCPLEVVFKAILQNHIYFQMYDRNEKGELYEPHKLVMYKQENVVLSRTKNHRPKNVWCLSFWGGWNDLWVACVYLSDYKKTWWLKEDLSE